MKNLSRYFLVKQVLYIFCMILFMLSVTQSAWSEKIGVLYIVHGGMETLTSENRGELMWNASITMFVYDHNHSVYKYVIWNPAVWPTVLDTGVTAMARKYQLMYDFAYDAIGNFDPFNTLTDGQAADLQAALNIVGAPHDLEFEVEWAGWLGVDRIENFAYPRYVYNMKDDAVFATSNCNYCGELDKENVTLDFEKGTTAFTKGAILSGSTSSATATIEEVTLISGGWAGGDATGYLLLSGVSESLRFQNGEPIVDNGAGSATAVGITHWRNCDPERFNVDGSVERLLQKGVTRIIVVGMTMSGIRFLKGFQTVQLAKKCLEDWNNDHGTSIQLTWVNDPNNLMERSYPTEPEGWTRSLYEPITNPYVPLEGNPNPLAEDPRIAELHVDGIETSFSDLVSDADTGVVLTDHAIFNWCETFDPKINDTITVQENIKSMLLDRHPDMDPDNIVGAYGGGMEVNPENGIFEYTREQRGDRLGTAYLYESDKQMPDYPWGFSYWEALEHLKERGVEHIVVGFPQVSTTSALDLTEIPNQYGKEIGIKTWAKWGTWDFDRYPTAGHPFADYWGVHMYTTCGPDAYSSTEYDCCFEMGGCGDGRPYPSLRQTPIDEARNEFDPSLVFDLSDYGHLGYDPTLGPPNLTGPVQDQYTGTWDMYEPPDDDPRLGPILAEHVLKTALCGNDIGNAGEVCGEPGLNCSTGATCLSNCRCVEVPSHDVTPPEIRNIVADYGDGYTIPMENGVCIPLDTHRIVWVAIDPDYPNDGLGWASRQGVEHTYFTYKLTTDTVWSSEIETVLQNNPGYYGRWSWVYPVDLITTEGIYDIKLIAEDGNGNRTELIYEIVINTEDTDEDGIAECMDNCPAACNLLQLDADTDGIGDVCDLSPGCGSCGQDVCEQDC